MAKIHGVMDIRAKFEAIPSQRSWDTTFTRMGGVEGQTEGWDRWPVPAWRCKNVYKKFYVGLRTGLISHETVESIFSNRSHRLKRSRSACFAKCQTIPFFGTTSWWLKCTNTCTNWQTRTCTHTHTHKLYNYAMKALFTLLHKHNLLRQVPRLNLGGYKAMFKLAVIS